MPRVQLLAAAGTTDRTELRALKSEMHVRAQEVRKGILSKGLPWVADCQGEIALISRPMRLSDAAQVDRLSAALSSAEARLAAATTREARPRGPG
jgi:hypothetical protein